MIKSIYLTAVLSLIPFSLWASNEVDNRPMPLDRIEVLLGRWYEIARFNHGFEKGQDNVMAFYSRKADGTLTVTNSGWKSGKMKTANGKIKLTSTPGRLRVSFFWPFYSDYRVLMMAGDNSYALIGGSSGKYLWILSRTPEMTQRAKNRVLREAATRGYSVSDLIWVDQRYNINGAQVSEKK